MSISYCLCLRCEKFYDLLGLSASINLITADFVGMLAHAYFDITVITFMVLSLDKNFIKLLENEQIPDTQRQMIIIDKTIDFQR